MTNQNQGEGNRDAARAYNANLRAHKETSDVAAEGQEAKAALDGKEGAELEKARRETAAEAKEHDPQVKRDR